MHVEVVFFDSAEHLTRRLTTEQRAALPHVLLPQGCATVDGLLRELRIIGGSGGTRPLVMVNGAHQRDDVPLHAGDRVEILQPMAGG